MRAVAVVPDEFPWLDPGPLTFCLALSDGERAWYSGHTASRQDVLESRTTIEPGFGPQLATIREKLLAIDRASPVRMSDGTVTALVYLPVRCWPSAPHGPETPAGDLDIGLGPAHVVRVPVDRLIRSSADLEVELTVDAGPTGRTQLLAVDPLAEDGSVPEGATFLEQYRTCLRHLEALLTATGAGLGSVVKVHEIHVGGHEATEARRVREAAWGGHRPAVTAVWVSAPRVPGAAVSLIVTTAGGPLEQWGDDATPWAVSAGGEIHLSGVEVRASDPDGLVQASIHAYHDLSERLADLPFQSQLVRTNEWVTADALPSYRQFGDVRRASLREPWPASAGLVCHGFGHASGVLLDCAAIAVGP